MSDKDTLQQPIKASDEEREAMKAKPAFTRVLDLDAISSGAKLDAEAIDAARASGEMTRLAEDAELKARNVEEVIGPSNSIQHIVQQMKRHQDMPGETVRSYHEPHNLLGLGTVLYHEMAELALQPSLELRRLADEVSLHHDNARLAVGAIEEFRQVGVFDHGARISAEIERMKLGVTDYEARFRLPDHLQTARLIAEEHQSRIADLVSGFRTDLPHMQRAMEAMRSPWLDAMNTARSVAGFVELQGIGRALQAFPPFDERLANALRPSLGDWRGEIDWPPIIATDAVARSQFYVGRGFNPALTDFPASAFDESIFIAGLKADRPREREDYEPSDEDESDLEDVDRASEAHRILFRFERRVRSFIDSRMSAVCGPDWAKQRAPMYRA